MSSNDATMADEQAGQTRYPSFNSELQPAQDILDYLREYSRERPDMVALWCFGIGFVLGWKLKPW